MTKALQKDIDTIVKQIVDNYKPEKIILFGSAARGDIGPDSDVDLCIIKPGVDAKRGGERYRDVAENIPNSIAVDAIVYTPYELKKRLYLRDPFVLAIMQEGKVLYGT